MITKNEFEILTAREHDVLYLIANGNSNYQIASILYLSPHTIKVIVKSIFKKLGARNRAQAVYIAEENNILLNNMLLSQYRKN